MTYTIRVAESAFTEFMRLPEDTVLAILMDLESLRDAPYDENSFALQPEPTFTILHHRRLPTNGHQVVYTVDDHHRTVLVAHVTDQF
ncbi:hypothetical protein GCM10010441_77530 [Kitasatospora paracochleata]|uniref:mRNA-degrading endonuclease RelE of RelBE toxin-antitoxin system n=1 Tax=Kitasatospora paracochleata TaxID=58354 RepID=A0ABT1JA69_9ACTN|nr:hypothetical protein [Kitasatospora paracochleata]MCP2314009.1 mRNA-degrading endonuclease RelE of RelBE toxin-antitoxin system [Kitasatospora paracochleata]